MKRMPNDDVTEDKPDDGQVSSTNSWKGIVNKSKSSIEEWDIKKSGEKISNKIRRGLRESDSASLLTASPILAVILGLILTIILMPHSGILDCRDGFDNEAICKDEPSLNVNGDLEVYLPTDENPESVKNLIAEVEEDWTTNVMVIYVESEDYNVSQISILRQIDNIERTLNPVMSDEGIYDDVIYVLSISTVIKEVNSSGGRVIKAFASGIAEAVGQGDRTDEFNETIDSQQDVIGNYAIPDEQQRVDQILQEMPQNALKKLVRDVGKYNEDGSQSIDKVNFWNRGVIIIGISDDLGENRSVGDIVSETQSKIDQLAIDEGWSELNLTMTLTGPAPLTNAVTEESFKLFWEVFPVGVVLVALGLFIFHCDLLQTGNLRVVQGIKVVIMVVFT